MPYWTNCWWFGRESRRLTRTGLLDQPKKALAEAGAERGDGTPPVDRGGCRQQPQRLWAQDGDHRTGPLPLDIPRDRTASFEPHLVAKHQRRLAGFDDRVIAMYARGMMYARDRRPS